MVELDLSSALGARFGNTDALAVMIANELIWTQPSAGVTFPATSNDVTQLGTGASNNLVFTVPTNVANGDVLVAFVMDRTGLTPPSGWTQQTKFATLGTFGIWTKAVPDKTLLTSTYTWTGASSGRGGGVMFRVVGANATTPVAQIGAISAAGLNQGDATHFSSSVPLSLAGITSGDATIAFVGSFYVSNPPPPTTMVPGFTELNAYANANAGGALAFGVYTDTARSSGDLTCDTWTSTAQNGSGILISFNKA